MVELLGREHLGEENVVREKMMGLENAKRVNSLKENILRLENKGDILRGGYSGRKKCWKGMMIGWGHLAKTSTQSLCRLTACLLYRS